MKNIVVKCGNRRRTNCLLKIFYLQRQILRVFQMWFSEPGVEHISKISSNLLGPNPKGSWAPPFPTGVNGPSLEVPKQHGHSTVPTEVKESFSIYFKWSRISLFRLTSLRKNWSDLPLHGCAGVCVWGGDRVRTRSLPALGLCSPCKGWAK